MPRRKSSEVAGGMNMTPMIDIVFQMIIFFVCTVQLEKDAINEKIRLAMAPHGPAEEKKDPLTVIIDVDDRGQISIARRVMSVGTLQAVLRKTVADYGRMVPVVVRGDIETRHADIKKVMDTCSQVGIWKIRFAAIKDRAG
jgi:biopolymer transport protein ExbD